MKDTHRTIHSRMRVAVAIAVAACAVASAAQPPVAFEAVSIHRNLSGSTNTHINITGGRVTMTNASLKTLIRNAYDIQSFQFGGGPSWLDSDFYDIAATTGDRADISNGQYRALLRGLLTDRFQLKVHWETRQSDVYALVIAKGGPKLTESPDPSKAPGLNTNKQSHQGRMTATNAPMLYLSSNLGNQLSRTVIDKTGLQGKYDWTLVWDPDPSADSTSPSLFTAVQEQLGLKLDPQKGPVETLVIDSVEHPSEN
jgi:uncharacterized protein (TIGR03435 family)